MFSLFVYFHSFFSKLYWKILDDYNHQSTLDIGTRKIWEIEKFLFLCLTCNWIELSHIYNEWSRKIQCNYLDHLMLKLDLKNIFILELYMIVH